MKLRSDTKLNKSQKIILLTASAVILSIGVFWIFIYGPSRGTMNKLKTEFTAIRSEIDKVEEVSGGEKDLEVTYGKFYKRYNDLKEMIPAEERSTLNALSSEADRMKIEVLTVKPDKVTKSKMPVTIQGISIYEMPISMNIKCDYITLGEYLDTLRERFNTLISVDSIEMKGSKKMDAPLDIWLKVTLYMLRK